MRFRLSALILPCFLAGPPALHAADESGQFAVKGAGIADCSDFLQATRDRTEKLYLYGGWINGYVSALNQTQEETYDLTPWQTTDFLATFIARYCEQNPSESFFKATADMVADLKSQRLRQRAQRVPVAVGEFKTHLYASTIKFMQERLKLQGHFQGPINSTYDPKTQEAVAAFQRGAELEATGFPDQITLLRLFY